MDFVAAVAANMKLRMDLHRCALEWEFPERVQGCNWSEWLPYSNISRKKKRGGLWAHKLGFVCPTCDPVSNSISVCDDSPTPSVPPVWDKGIQEGQRNENSGGKEEPSSPFPHPKMYFLTSGWVSRAARSNPLHLPGCLPKAVVVSQCPWDAGPHSQGSMSGLSSSGSHLRWSPLSHLTWCQMSLWCLLPPAYRFFSFAVVTAIPFCHAGSFGFGLFFFCASSKWTILTAKCFGNYPFLLHVKAPSVLGNYGGFFYL